MIPSVIARQIRRGVEDFLLTTFPITNPFFAGTLEKLLTEPAMLFRGPYLSVKLPFVPADDGPRPFPAVLPVSFPPYRHQQQAWERLDTRVGRSTVVATGTGSGKTECFLYPVLDHCFRQRGRRGIKAILIYPMNALATDQAQRLAKMIWRNSELRGFVTAGLWIGGLEREASPVMTEEDLITDKQMLRDAPPDILITNYKMLDYLLVRPRDARLWRLNEPGTLRYLVVDELHTFDGAQGADLACLVRRIKERVKTPQNHLCCVGTSATLGEGSQADLASYARELFGEPFDDESVIGESLLTTDEFLKGCLVTRFQTPGTADLGTMDPLAYESVQDYVRAQSTLWMGSDLSQKPVMLAEALKQHAFFRNLLTILGNRAVAAGDLAAELKKQLPGFGELDDAYLDRLLGSFMALVSRARILGPVIDEKQKYDPLVQIRMQLWLRELRRMVASVRREGKIEHAVYCRYWGKEEKEKVIEACFLYREFTSEAIRMLLPVASFDVERNIHSFVAALDVGLRKKFRGDPGHLMTTVTDEPVPGSDIRKRYLVLYDGVPGGTGYLKELMRDQQNLLGVFELAYEVLKNCICQNDADKDGCYRCLLAYRGRHDQNNTSRHAAVEILKLILDNRQHLKRTERLDAIRLNRLLESELEGRFIEALRRTPEGEPPRSVTHHVVNGKEGFYLRSELGNYLIEPQVDLGHMQGVAVPCRADFVFFPERPEPEELPIVIFTDGYEYHADPNAGLRTGSDTAQRMALMRSGRYRVWSLTWDDVQEQFRFPVPRFDAELVSPGAKFGPLVGNLDPTGAGIWKSLGSLSSFGALMLLLGAARRRSWANYAQAFAISLLENDPDKPGALRLRCHRNHSDGSPLLRVEGEMRAADLQSRSFEALFLRLHLFDDYAHHGITEWKRAWREFLRLGNLLQFIVRFDFVSSIGLADDMYQWIFDSGRAGKSPVGADGAVPDQLAILLELVDAEVSDLCRAVAARGKILPEPGFELTGPQGEIIATAELAWPASRIAVLLRHEADGAGHFEAEGWRVHMSELMLGTPEMLLDLLPNEVAE